MYMSLRKKTSINLQNEEALKEGCPFNYTLFLIGKRWKPVIIWKIKEGYTRFGDFKREIPLISEKMLTQHLRELEVDGFITRTVYPETPLRVEYSLTDFGKSILPVLQALHNWGEWAIETKK